MLELEDALGRILAAIPPPVPERITLGQASGRVLHASVHAPINLPPFDNSAMDGYALRAADIANACADAPVRMRIIGKVAAGEHFSGAVSPGTCVRLFTGSSIPRGADAVVMQEDTRAEAGQPEHVLVLDRVEPGENLRRSGEDVACGSLLAPAGARMGFAQIALLGAAGLAQLEAGRQPRVGVVSTGSELKEPGQPLGEGQVYESNRLALEALIRQAGGLPLVFPPVADSLTATRDVLIHAFNTCDVVVTSGGASVGELDFIKPAFKASGGELEFWKVSMKPGRPFAFGRRDGRLLFGLPGNPVSALVTFLLLVRPALLRWQGATELSLPSHPGVLAEALVNPGTRRHFLRVRMDNAGSVFSAGAQASHALSSLAAANGLVDVPPDAFLPAGSAVKVLRWD